MKYDAEADWTLLTTCNFRCAYCFVSENAQRAKIKAHGTPVQWKEGFDATGKTWLIHITGGEPTLYPDFVDLCEQLSQSHYLSINSNLCHRTAEEFAWRIDPQRVHFINAALHDEERQKKEGRSVFIDRVHALLKRNFNVLVSQVMTPRLISIFSEVAKHFESHGLYIIPKLIRGNFEGKIYPDAYSTRQKQQIREYMVEARRQYLAVIERMNEPATIDLFQDERFLDRIPSYRGKLCGSGYNFVRINPDGSVICCGSKKCLGNLLYKKVKLWNAPKPCNTSYCPYFCEKYTSSQRLLRSDQLAEALP
jgi:MoaA/NifB/PqqE/SkfB family radical SAM enzyme